MKLFRPKLIFQEELARPENKKIHIFCLLREKFSNISTKEKISCSFLYKEGKFFKLKNVLIIIIKHFFFIF